MKHPLDQGCGRCGAEATTAHVNRSNLTPVLLCAPHREEHAPALRHGAFKQVAFTDAVSEVAA